MPQSSISSFFGPAAAKKQKTAHSSTSQGGSKNEAIARVQKAAVPDPHLRKRFLEKLAYKAPQTVEEASAELTPLEKQVLALKAKHPDILLLIEVGYKFQFFGQDARVASDVLGIACFKSRAFLTASVPVHRLDVHVNRLVQAGHKVGVVHQTETAALKAAGENKSKTFERELSEVVTRGTYLGDSAHSGWIVCVYSQGRKFALVAVRIETGEILYDEFEDDRLYSELDRRLAIIDVVEVVAASEIPTTALQILSRSDRRLTHVSLVHEHGPADESVLTPALVDCFATLRKYLAEFGLDKILRLEPFFTPFRDRMSMQLPVTSLTALELFHNTHDGQERGSLFWVLNHTVTQAGRRLLRQWLAAPLVDLSKIEARHAAVRSLVDAHGTPLLQIEKLKRLLRRLPDLERGLNKMLHKKSSRSEALESLLAFDAVNKAFDGENFALGSANLDELFGSLSHAPVSDLLAELNIEAASANDLYNTFKESANLDRIADHKLGILIVESDLDEHLSCLATELQYPSLAYMTVAGVEYLLELPNDKAKHAPRDWIKVNGTKAISRFHTPTVLRLLAERAQRKELLAQECDKAFADFLTRVCEKYDQLRSVAQALAQLDGLLSLAHVSSQPGYSLPSMTADGPIDIKQARHAVIEKLASAPFVPNDVFLVRPHCMLLTGPNMGGKSSMIRQIAICCLLAQMGCYIPAERATLPVLDGIYCRMGASDNWIGRESTFMVELHETAGILSSATERSLVIMDELGRGTSTQDGLAVASAVLRHLVTDTCCITLFVTHYRQLASMEALLLGKVSNWHMGYRSIGERIVFLYLLTRGAADKSYGLNVARMAQIPAEVVSVAESIAAEQESLQYSARERLTLADLARLISIENVTGIRLLDDKKN
ncbi:Mismatch repair protein msh3 [Savitreella phatthalungensis]